MGREQVLTSKFHVNPAVLDRGSSRTFSKVKNRLLSSGTSNGWVAWLVGTRAFTFITTFLIVINALFVGIVADSEMRAAIADYHGEEREQVITDEFAHYVSMFFTFAFALELVLRVVHMRWFFIFGAGHHWNFLDVLFVTAGLLEMAVDGGESFEVNYLRALRLLRLLRAATLLRSEPIFGRLRLMLLALGGCLQSLLWVVVLLAFSMYLFAVVFLNTATSYVRSSPEEDLDFDTVTTFFGSMQMTLLTLSMSVLGGVSWWEVERTFLNVSPFCSVLLLVYVALMVLALLNIVTGVFVNDSIDVAQNDHDIRTTMEMQHKRELVHGLKLLFKDIDLRGSGHVTLQEFTSALEKEEVQVLFSALGLDVSDAIGVFHVLDADENNVLEIDEFVMGCQGFKGTATALDLVHLTSEVKRTRKRLAHLEHQGAQQLRMMKALMASGGLGVTSGPLVSVIDPNARRIDGEYNDFLTANANVP